MRTRVVGEFTHLSGVGDRAVDVEQADRVPSVHDQKRENFVKFALSITWVLSAHATAVIMMRLLPRWIAYVVFCRTEHSVQIRVRRLR